MARKIRPELSSKNKYHLSKHRYYELKHFCLQYYEWKEELLKLTYLQSVRPSSTHSIDISDITCELAMRRINLEAKISQVENSAKQTDSYLYPYLLEAVTKDLAYPYLQTHYNIACSRDYYYENYRKFFWILSISRE